MNKLLQESLIHSGYFARNPKEELAKTSVQDLSNTANWKKIFLVKDKLRNRNTKPQTEQKPLPQKLSRNFFCWRQIKQDFPAYEHREQQAV